MPRSKKKKCHKCNIVIGEIKSITSKFYDGELVLNENYGGYKPTYEIVNGRKKETGVYWYCKKCY